MLSGRVVERLVEEARRLDMTPEEYLLELLTRDLDPEDRAREYVQAARDLLAEARVELERGNVRQAAEEVWGAAALAVKAYAYWRGGERLSSHGELWAYSLKVAGELGEWVKDAWSSAVHMHVCFYEGWCAREHVEAALERVGRLVEEVGRRVEEGS